MGLPVGSVCLVQFVGLWAQQRILFNHTYKVTSDASPDTPFVRSQEIASFMETSPTDLLTRYLACLTNDYSLKQVRFQVIYPTRYQYGAVSSTKTGGDAGAATTGNVAGVVTLQTGIAGRSEISNKHIGPVRDSRMVLGAPTSSYVTLLDNLGSALATDFSDTIGGSLLDMKTVIYHRKIGQTSPVVIWQVSDRIGTLRRRTLRVGE